MLLKTAILQVLVLVIAWVAVKFGINTMSVVLEMGIHLTRRSRVEFTISNTTLVVFISNFTAIPMLFPVNTIYSLHIHMLCISVAMYAICHYVLNMRQH